MQFRMLVLARELKVNLASYIGSIQYVFKSSSEIRPKSDLNLKKPCGRRSEFLYFGLYINV